MTSVAVTVVGRDRPGVVAEVAAAIAELGGNLEDSSMTLLRGHFAMTLIADVSAPTQRIADRLAGLSDEGLAVSVFPVPDDGVAAPSGPRYVLSVHGADRPGIVSRAAGVVAERGGNVVDVSTRLAHDFYVLTAEVEFPVGADMTEVTAAIAEVARELGVTATLHACEEDVL
ncbi:MAG: ACT domain-containing protein [Candidatus Nanopelagicales bacterium]|nr:ACT domain-containing protein [Candidatus Nanopelagicales bacterium]